MADAPTEPTEFWIDRGGTFTDVIARRADGSIEALKLLSDSDAYGDAATEGVRRMLGLAPGAAIPEGALAAVKMGTTVATNALLELDGAKTLFVVTEGFGDLFEIGDQTRPDIFALNITRPAPLPARTVEIAGRLAADGAEVAALDEDAARVALEAAKADGFEAVAVALLHSHVNEDHERRIEALARKAGFDHVTLSSEASPLIKLFPRASTAVIDAYLEPVLRDYVGRVDRGLAGAPLYFMQSGGGLSQAKRFRARDAVLSGPAGGVVGMALTAKAAGFDKVIGFDMGGTSTDVSRFDGTDYARTDTALLDGRILRAPMLQIHTVAAGGGSVLGFDGERALVGPKSAGADPGPACYGRGGPPAVTDANVVLGRIQPDWFPKVFGPNHDAPLDAGASHAKLKALAEQMGLDSAEAAAEGFLAVAVEAMADAVKQISTSQGVDPRRYALNAFGGAGGQHACKLADALGMTTALIHPQAGLLSAYGIGLAPVRDAAEQGLETALDGGLARAADTLDALEALVRDAVARQGGEDIHTRKEIRLRAAGSDTAVPVGFGSEDEIRARFDAAHEQLFGFAPGADGIVIDSVAAMGEGRPRGARGAKIALGAQTGAPQPAGAARLHHAGAWREASVYSLSDLGAGAQLTGPALIMDANQTIVLDPGWRAERRADGMLVLVRQAEAGAEPRASTERDPVTLELFNRRFMSVAEQMGVVLERTAHSVNIKERLDFSCAVFDADGGLVANAPHMPVHLGSMSASVRAAIEAHPDLGPGDAVALNAPYNGGTHLPDVTVIQPVCAEDGERLFFVASRGHHADIGGIAPGSMPPFSKTIEDEGVVFDAVKILSRGRFDEDAVRGVLESGAHPARRPGQNIADLKAQLAACARGARELKAMIATEGLDVVRAYMGHVQDNAEAAVRRVIGALSDGEAEMALDDGASIRVAIRVDRQAGEAEIDFTGTSAQLGDNFNAPSAVARAAVLYVLRCLVEDPIPLNEGCLKPIRLIVPEGSMLSPVPPAAVVAGNVETSQLVVDALFAATGRMAAAQGTMNNFTFGDGARQYYETICGGAGAGLDAAGRGFHGASAVHTHMTNSRLTDPEVLELRYPIRVLGHAVRRGSGGAGRWRGGDGSVRRIEFLEPMQAALLSGRRTVAPPGLNGGEAGAPGKQRLVKAGGAVENLPAKFRVQIDAGDAIEIETPGGAGFSNA
ncbi:MAG: hydantoinase B/oxoprolinase family protein [Oceanicaulis sp.]